MTRYFPLLFVVGMAIVLALLVVGMSMFHNARVARSAGSGTSLDVEDEPSKPLCEPYSRYSVTQLNAPVSPCDLFFFVDRVAGGRESRLRVVIERGAPIPIRDGQPYSIGGLRPYWYRWVVLDERGAIERSWLAHFQQNRDGVYHTIVDLPEMDWQRSRLEIYFEDVNGDGVREDVTFDLDLPAVLAGEVQLRQPDARSQPAIPLIDLSAETHRQVIVDREPGQYLGHPTTVLLEDGKTILCVYPTGHGSGGIVLKRSNDGGLSWSERLPTPKSWETSRETPTIHRAIDAAGTKRLILWSGLYPARLSVSEDDGRTWSELAPAGEWGGIVVMSSVVKLQEPGHYLALFHDDGRFFRETPDARDPPVFTLYQSRSTDGGLGWGEPEAIFASSEIHLCEPGAVRSPDGKRLALLLRENARRKNAHIIFSDDEGKTWSDPRELPASLTGDRHVAVYAPDGRLFISFRDMADGSATRGDWVAWVGTWEDLETGGTGQYRVRLMDNKHAWDAAYPGMEVLPDGTIVATTYGHWTQGEPPYIVSVRLRLEELDAKVQE